MLLCQMLWITYLLNIWTKPFLNWQGYLLMVLSFSQVLLDEKYVISHSIIASHLNKHACRYLPSILEYIFQSVGLSCQFNACFLCVGSPGQQRAKVAQLAKFGRPVNTLLLLPSALFGLLLAVDCKLLLACDLNCITLVKILSFGTFWLAMAQCNLTFHLPELREDFIYQDFYSISTNIRFYGN